MDPYGNFYASTPHRVSPTSQLPLQERPLFYQPAAYAHQNPTVDGGAERLDQISDLKKEVRLYFRLHKVY